MKPIDYLKALGVAVAVMVLNLLITTAVIAIYATLIEPGQPPAHYTAMAPVIGAWSGPLGGMSLMFLMGWVFARRRPVRNGLLFVAVVFAIYLALDVAIGLAAVPASALFTLNFAASLGGAFLAGVAGAAVGQRRRG
jgi:hypothetical protein